MKAYHASAKDCGTTADTPRTAGLAFFEKYPTKRKCNIIEGDSNDGFFTMTFSRHKPPAQWRDVTKKTAGTLPELKGETA